MSIQDKLNGKNISEMYISDGSHTRCTRRNQHGVCLETTKDARIVRALQGRELVYASDNCSAGEVRAAKKYARQKNIPVRTPPAPFGETLPL